MSGGGNAAWRLKILGYSSKQAVCQSDGWKNAKDNGKAKRGQVVERDRIICWLVKRFSHLVVVVGLVARAQRPEHRFVSGVAVSAVCFWWTTSLFRIQLQIVVSDVALRFFLLPLEHVYSVLCIYFIYYIVFMHTAWSTDQRFLPTTTLLCLGSMIWLECIQDIRMRLRLQWNQ